jgi:long-chain fatty acid transport protein
MKKLGMLFLVGLIGFTAEVFAAGLSIPEQGAAAMGMSAAMTARSQDLSSIFYNPAGLDYVERNELFIGLTPIGPAHKYEGAGVSKNSEREVFFPPQVYFAHRVNPRTVFGLGIYSPFGLGTDWGDTWAGRYTSTYAEIQALYFTPTLSYQITKWLSAGLGYSWVWSSATIESMFDSGLIKYANFQKDPSFIANPNYDSKFHLNGEGGGTNWNAGILLKPSKTFQIGVAYRGPTNIKYTGKAKFIHQDFRLRNTKIDTLFAQTLETNFPTLQNGETTLHLPASVNSGILVRFTEKWDASFDVNYMRWQTYDKLVIKFDKKLPQPEKVQAKDWKNSTCYRLGTSFTLSELTVLRAGMLYDLTPVPDATLDSQLPDANRLGFSVGYGRKVGMINLDFSYLFLKFSNRDKKNFVGYQDVTNEFPPTATSKKDGVVNDADQAMLNYLYGGKGYPVGNGTYKSNANLFSVSASVKF